VIVIPDELFYATTAAITHDGSGNFIVHSYTAGQLKDLLDIIGAYRGKNLLPEDMAVLQINTDGHCP
jgi:hypothetical protein